MSRYIKDIDLDQPIDVVSMMMDDYIYHEGFTRSDWKGEMVHYCKDAEHKERYMRWSYTGGNFHIEAWIKGPMGGETDLDGAGKSRTEFRRSLNQLIERLKAHDGGMVTGDYIGSDPLHHGEHHTGEMLGAHTREELDPQGSANDYAAGAGYSAPGMPQPHNGIEENPYDTERKVRRTVVYSLFAVIAVVNSYLFSSRGYIGLTIGIISMIFAAKIPYKFVKILMLFITGSITLISFSVLMNWKLF